MARSVALVAKAADFSDAGLGWVNINPLPEGLPSGLVDFRLMRKNTIVCSRNRVDGSEGAIEIVNPQETLTFTDTSVEGGNIVDGLLDRSISMNYTNGFTILAVTRIPETSDFHYVVASADWVTDSPPVVVGRGWRIEISSTLVQVFVFHPEGTAASPSIPTPGMFTPSPTPGDLVMVMMSFDPNAGEYGTRYHKICGFSNQSASGSALLEAATRQIADPDAGVAFGYNPNPGTPSTSRPSALYAFGLADEAWDTDDMDAAYALLKPWLARRGVEIM